MSLTVSAGLGLAAALMLIRIGLAQRALDARQPLRCCASCGREYRGRRCSWCAAHS